MSGTMVYPQDVGLDAWQSVYFDTPGWDRITWQTKKFPAKGVKRVSRQAERSVSGGSKRVSTAMWGNAVWCS